MRHACLAIALCLAGQSAAAASYTTTLSFDAAATGNDLALDALEIDFDTDVMSGVVFEEDLTDLALSLIRDGMAVYTDRLIIDGTVQPIGGVDRELDGVSFDVDLDAFAMDASAGLNEAFKDVFAFQFTSDGETFDVAVSRDFQTQRVSATITQFVDGFPSVVSSQMPERIVTVEMDAEGVQPIPLPAGLPLALAGLASLGALRIRARA